jgi:hypothetical protein
VLAVSIVALAVVPWQGISDVIPGASGDIISHADACDTSGKSTSITDNKQRSKY